MHIMYPDLVHPLHYSLSSPITILKKTSVDFNISYSNMYTKYTYHIHPSLPSSLTFPLPVTPSPYHDLFYLPVLCYLFVHCSVWFCLCILPANILYFNRSNPLYYSPYPFPLTLLTCNSFHCVLFCLPPIQKWCISIIYSIICFFFSCITHLL
jgi:hypothetical protein